MPTELLVMLENISAMTDDPIMVTNTPTAWIISINGVEKFRLEKDDE